MQLHDMPTIQQVIAYIDARPSNVKLTELADAADCSVSWLNQFLAGKIPEPGYNKIKIIIETINNKQAENVSKLTR